MCAAIKFEPVSQKDLASVRELNEDNLPHVSTISVELLDYFCVRSEVFDVVKVDDELVGFVIALPPGLDYGSLNYRWFEERYSDYCYIDRIMIRNTAHGLGLGRQLYDRVVEQIKGRALHLVCEVNVEPPNPRSMRFHEQYGFSFVGSQVTEGGSKKVSLLLKDLTAL